MRLFTMTTRSAMLTTATPIGMFMSQSALANECLIDTNQDGTATAGVDTINGATDNSAVANSSRLACGPAANAGVAGTAIGSNANASGSGGTAVGNGAGGTFSNITTLACRHSQALRTRQPLVVLQTRVALGL